MMIEKNTELQKQALELHKKKVKKVSIVEPDKNEGKYFEKIDTFADSEREIMVEVIK